MSYSNTNVEITYDGDGLDQSFSVNFHYLEGVTFSIQVELWNYTDPNLPIKESFVLNVDYTIDESGYPNTLVNTTDPIAVDYKLVIFRSTLPIQTSSFVNGAFPPESVEEAIDKTMMATQEQSAKLGRAILNPIGGPTITTEDIAQAVNDTSALEVRVTDNESAITTNISGIADHETRIGDNEAAISAINSAISGITLPVIVPITSGIVHNASDKEIIIIDTAGTVQVNLPLVLVGLTVGVKLSSNTGNKTIVSSEGIDGFGTTYTLSSSYESVNLVSDGIKWYII